MDLWVKIEDFMDEHGNIQTIRERDFGVVAHLEYRLYSQRGISHEVYMDPKVMERIFTEMMVGIQQSYEKRIFERLPTISEKYRLGGQELNYYITSNAPMGKPMLIINPEDWTKKWNPSIYTSPIAWMFMEMKRNEMLDRKKELDQEHVEKDG